MGEWRETLGSETWPRQRSWQDLGVLMSVVVTCEAQGTRGPPLPPDQVRGPGSLGRPVTCPHRVTHQQHRWASPHYLTTPCPLCAEGTP